LALTENSFLCIVGKHRKNSNDYSKEGSLLYHWILSRKLKDLHPKLGKQTSNMKDLKKLKVLD
ncbi:Hypothetical protein FKW44_003465, partial [Caligus rogercresseyi]